MPAAAYSTLMMAQPKEGQMKSTLGLAAITVVLAIVSPAAWALQLVQSAADPQPDAITVEDLKEVYLLCERTAFAGAMSADDAMACSVIYEDLKRLGFHGDAARLREWSAPLLGIR
jgi:hypothetical protein